MASKKGVGSTKNGRDSASKRLGVKKYAGQTVIPGNILIKQRGTKYHPGKNVRRGGDDCLYAVSEGVVKFEMRRGKKFITIVNNEELKKRPGKLKAAA